MYYTFIFQNIKTENIEHTVMKEYIVAVIALLLLSVGEGNDS